MRDTLKSLTDVQLVMLPLHAHDNGELVVIEEGKSIAFASARMFTVRARAGAVRGEHAHKRCAQFLVCVHGAIEVVCDDGADTKTFLLDAGNKGLLVPPSIWATENYVTEGAVLSVLCDRHYDADDYLRDYDRFLAWRKADE
jgi:dTDP-4-dehydrorhamnose 3,5-epimerase-like enzyme